MYGGNHSWVYLVFGNVDLDAVLYVPFVNDRLYLVLPSVSRSLEQHRRCRNGTVESFRLYNPLLSQFRVVSTPYGVPLEPNL